jgi:hypothetical protein
MSLCEDAGRQGNNAAQDPISNIFKVCIFLDCILYILISLFWRDRGPVSPDSAHFNPLIRGQARELRPLIADVISVGNDVTDLAMTSNPYP